MSTILVGFLILCVVVVFVLTLPFSLVFTLVLYACYGLGWMAENPSPSPTASPVVESQSADLN